MTRREKRFATTLVAALCAAAVLLMGAAGGYPVARESGGGDPVYLFTGSGRAHGVGLCMDGVKYRAIDGHSYREIINYYYTGVTFGRVDDNQPIRVKCRDNQIRTYTMRDYLYHLQEEPEDYPFEGLKVLYVAARTYTLSCIARGKHAHEGFDICSSGNCCQAMDENKDLSKYPNNRAAVDQTAGQVILYDGKIITAAYCGSCGGHTDNNEDVWGGTAIPYLRGKPDSYCDRSSRFSWSASFRKSEVEARLNSREDTSIGRLYLIDLSRRTPGGRVKTARLIGSDAIKEVSGGVFAALFGFQSTKFDLVRENFDEYILVLNPNDEPSVVTFTFMQPDGGVTDHIVEVGPNSRFTLKVNDYQQLAEVSTRVVSGLPVIAERAMYFSHQGKFTAGHGSTGVTEPAPKWYLAEGYTGGTFDTYVLVQNPQPVPVDVRFTFMLPAGDNIEHTAQAAPFSRMTLHLNGVGGLEDTEVSTVVESVSGDGIIAERSSYFDYHGCDGGHNAPGVTSPAEQWYLAEGYTGGDFDTYILLQNPTDDTCVVEASYLREKGGELSAGYRLKPRSRMTISADRIKGLENAGFSTSLHSVNGVGFIAERAMYFDYNGCGLDDGHDSVGASGLSEEWYFAEGYTGGLFDTWVLIGNPSDEKALVEVEFNTPEGTSVSREYRIRGRSRFTIPVDAVEGLSSSEVATTIRSLNGVPVVAERSVYFIYDNGYAVRDGGHNTVGVTSPSSTWYFAEGYTGL
jgi:SpoIID/LytB domain protein